MVKDLKDRPCKDRLSELKLIVIEWTNPGLGSGYARGSSLDASPGAASGDPAQGMWAERNTGSSERTSVFGTLITVQEERL